MAFDILFENISDQVGSVTKFLGKVSNREGDTVTHWSTPCPSCPLICNMPWLAGCLSGISASSVLLSSLCLAAAQIFCLTQSHVPFAHNGVAYKRCAPSPGCPSMYISALPLCANGEAVLQPLVNAS